MFSELRQKLVLRDSPPIDIERVRSAYEYASEIHKEHKRKTGEPYIIHPLAVADIVCDLGGDEDMIIAALLHDTVEDGDDHEVVEATIRTNFGRNVHYMVMALSKNCMISCKDRQQKEYVDQMAEAIETDTSVFFIKMADLLHNLSTIDGLSLEKRQKWVMELQSQYIPLLQDHYHHLSPVYHEMYFRLLERLEIMVCTNA